MDYINLFISQWNFAIAQKRFFLKIPYTILSYNIIIKLHSFGLFNYYEINSNLIYIFRPKRVIFKQISKPGNRQYWGLKKLKKNYMNFYILSTSQFSITSSIDAIFFRIGGEVLFQVII